MTALAVGWQRLAQRFRTFGGAVQIYHRAAPVAIYIRVGVALIVGLIPVLSAWLTRALLNGLAEAPGARLIGLAAGLAAAGLVAGVLQHLARYLDQEVTRRVGRYTQAELFATVVRPSGLAELENPAFHDQVQLARQSSQAGPVLLTVTVLSIAQSLITVTGFLVSLMTISPLAAALVLLSVIPTLVAQLRLSRMRSEAVLGNSHHMRRQAFYSSLLLDLRAAKEIRLFGLGGYFRERMLAELTDIQRSERAVDRATARTDSALTAVTAAISAAVLVGTVAQLAAGRGRLGDLAVLIAALTAVQVTIAGIVAQLATVDAALALFEHYLAVTRPAPLSRSTPLPRSTPLSRPSPLSRASPPEGAGIGSAETSDGGICFEDVWFRYTDDHPWVLRGLRLRLANGRAAALVGLNGAGKSTVVKLLCRLYEPTLGRITWNGVDIRTLDVDEFRARIAAVFQDFVCYEMSAYDNVAVGSLAAAEDPAAVPTATTRAGVHELLSSLPDGYQTWLTRTFVEERPTQAGSAAAGPASGVVLSGGQWQRVALARALLRADAELLILDEPSSGLDARAEAEIQHELRRHRAGRTSLLISHRLNTVRTADHIAVIVDGEVVEEGDHEVLMAADGRYAELFRMQADGFRDAVATTDGGQS